MNNIVLFVCLGCTVCPETYGLLTSWLAPLSMGRLILCLEGGYNLSSISYAMTICTKTLLGDPLPPVNVTLPLKPSALTDLKIVLNVQAKHWSALCFNKDLPREDGVSKSIINHIPSPINDLLSKMSALEIQEATVSSSVPDDWEDHITRVPHQDNKNGKRPINDSQKPGPSQSSSQGTTYNISISLDAFRDVSL